MGEGALSLHPFFCIQSNPPLLVTSLTLKTIGQWSILNNIYVYNKLKLGMIFER